MQYTVKSLRYIQENTGEVGSCFEGFCNLFCYFMHLGDSCMFISKIQSGGQDSIFIVKCRLYTL